MRESIKRYAAFALIALLSAAVGAAGGFSLVLLWSEPPQHRGADGCASAPEFAKAVDRIEAGLEKNREDIGALSLYVTEVSDFVAGLERRTADRFLRSSLPPPYVKKIDSFFENTEAARDLLMAKVQKRPGITFGKPVFVSSKLITVPYTIYSEKHHLLVQIKILELYELQFDVVWDSLEGEEP